MFSRFKGIGAFAWLRVSAEVSGLVWAVQGEINGHCTLQELRLLREENEVFGRRLHDLEVASALQVGVCE